MLMYSGLRKVGEAVKEKKRKPPDAWVCARSYAYAREARGRANCIVNWGERWKSGEECERKWGRGEGKGG